MYVTDDVDLDQFSDHELSTHLEANGYTVLDSRAATAQDKLLNEMYELYRNNRPIDEQLRKLFYTTLGRIA